LDFASKYRHPVCALTGSLGNQNGGNAGTTMKTNAWHLERCLNRSLAYILITTVALTVNALAQSWQPGFDFRNTATFVTDPPGATDVLVSTLYPTTGTFTTYG